MRLLLYLSASLLKRNPQKQFKAPNSNYLIVHFLILGTSAFHIPSIFVYILYTNILRASPTVLSMWLQVVKFIEKKSKCAGLAKEIGFSAPNSSSLPWLVKGATQLCTSKKECNKLDLTAAQYFWLVSHTDWSRWFAISTPYIYAVLVTVLLVGLSQANQLNLDI
jgi:hypothetical protein